jgi:hypothetical protein
LSQSVGVTYKTLIPSFSDDASIVEALRLYHYGIPNYSGQPIPTASIEGHFVDIDGRLTTLETTLSSTYVEQVSLTAAPNVITPQSSSTIPLVIRGAVSQSADLQEWQNSASATITKITSNGIIATSGYISIGDITPTTTTAAKIAITNATDKGITIKAATSQSANLQEWQNSSGTAVSWVTSDGAVYSKGQEIGSNTIVSFFLMGA